MCLCQCKHNNTRHFNCYDSAFFFSPVLTMTHRQNGVLSEPPAKAQTQDHILHLANFNDSEENSQKVFFCLGIFLFRKFIDPAPF